VEAWAGTAKIVIFQSDCMWQQFFEKFIPSPQFNINLGKNADK
jgi:hypothetical protein